MHFDHGPPTQLIHLLLRGHPRSSATDFSQRESDLRVSAASGILNVRGFFDHLLSFLDNARDEGFLRPENRRMLLTDTDAAGLVSQFERYTAPHVSKWFD